MCGVRRGPLRHLLAIDGRTAGRGGGHGGRTPIGASRRAPVPTSTVIVTFPVMAPTRWPSTGSTADGPSASEVHLPGLRPFPAPKFSLRSARPSAVPEALESGRPAQDLRNGRGQAQRCADAPPCPDHQGRVLEDLQVPRHRLDGHRERLGELPTVRLQPARRSSIGAPGRVGKCLEDAAQRVGHVSTSQLSTYRLNTASRRTVSADNAGQSGRTLAPERRSVEPSSRRAVPGSRRTRLGGPGAASGGSSGRILRRGAWATQPRPPSGRPEDRS